MLKQILNTASPFFNLPYLIRKANYLIFLPFYHTVSDKRLTHIEPLYAVKNVKTFKQDLDYLLTHFQPISIEDLVQHINQKQPISTPSFHLTFDDGLRECAEIIAPILKKKGIPASFFINPPFVDNQALFYRYKVGILLSKIQSNTVSEIELKSAAIFLKYKKIWKIDLKTSLLTLNHTHQTILDQIAEHFGIDYNLFLNQQRPYMTTSQIKTLQNDGFHIGAHSMNHPKYDSIPLQQQLNQTLNSANYIQQHFPSSINSFAFPFSSDGVNNDFFNAANLELDITFGTSGLKLDSAPKHLHRFPMEGKTLSASQLIKSEYLYYLIKRQFGKHIYNRS